MINKTILCSLGCVGLVLPLSAQEAQPAQPQPQAEQPAQPAQAAEQPAPAPAPNTYTISPEYVIKYKLELGEDITFPEVGTLIKQGESVIKVDLEALNEAIDEQDRALAATRLELAKLQLAQSQSAVAEQRKLVKAQTKVKRAEEDLTDYTNKFLPQQEKENKAAVWKSENNLIYQKENLRQLERMYKEDQITEESEEIILLRTRNEVQAAEDALEGIRIVSAWTADRKFPRETEDKKVALEDAQIELNNLVAAQALDTQDKDLALKNATVKLAKAEKALSKAKEKVEKATLPAPREGILLSWTNSATNGPKPVKNGSYVLLNPDGTLTVKKQGTTPIEVGAEIIIADGYPKGKIKAIDGDNVTVSFEEIVKKD